MYKETTIWNSCKDNIRKIGWTAILFAVFCIQTGPDKFPAFWLEGPDFHPHLQACQASFIWQLCHASFCPAEASRPADSTATAAIGCQGPRWHLLSLQPSDLLSHYPPIPSCLPRSHRAASNCPSFWSHWCSPVLRQQVLYLLASLAAAVNPFSVLPAPCFAHSFQFTWSKERACWNSAARTSCSALLPGSHQSQVSFFEISHTTASVPSGLSPAICQSVIFHLDCNASEHRAFAFTWLLISRCLTTMSLFLF